MTIFIKIALAVAAAGAVAAISTVIARNSAPLTETDAAEKIKTLIDGEVMKNDTVSGAVVLVDSPAYGIREIFTAGTAGGIPIRRDQPFHIASVGKAFTAVAAGILLERGEIGLEDPVSGYLSPELLKGLFVYKGADYSKTVTVRQLLNHTSGAADYFGDPAENSEPVKKLAISRPDHFWTPDELLEFTREHQKAVGRPGEKYHYSDTGYILLGLIIESASGRSFHQVLHEEIFEPLLMNDSYLMFYSEPVNKKRPMADIFLEGTLVNGYQSLSIDWAGGGIVSTAEDLAVFIRALNRGEIISKATLETLYQFDQKFMRGIHYGLGFMEYRFGEFFPGLGSLPEMRGHMGVLGTQMFYDEETDTVYVSSFGSTDYSAGSVQTMIRILGYVMRIKQ